MSATLQTDLALRLAGLRAALDEDLARVERLAAVRRRRAEIELLLADLDRQLERVRDAAVITLVGATGAGKSTLLNALVGAEVAQEGERRPTTSRPVIYAPADADLARLRAGLDGLGVDAPAIVRYDPAETSGRWTDQVLVDAPDVNSVATEHRDVVRALAERSDVLVVCMHHQSLVEEASVSFIDEFRGRRRLIFVLNRADELNDAARATLLDSLRELARTRWDAADAPVIATSARTVRERGDAPGWRELEGALERLVAGELLGRVRRRNALGTAARLGSVLDACAAASRDDLEQLAREAPLGTAALAQRAERELAERARARRADLVAELWTEAARRWDGPGGWALRAQGLAGLGLGAGAVLARRNPLLAAGAAVGGLAADRAREGLRASRLERARGLFAGEREFATWYLDALGGARLCAGRLVGAPDGLGVPDEQRAFERCSGAVEEAWERVRERDLPRTAERGVPAWLRALCDAPIYALGAWIAWRAVAGFFSGAYLGVDFLLNAALVALAYLFVVRVALRRALAWRARAVEAVLVEAAGAHLEAWRRATDADVAARVGDARSALERLAGLGARWMDELVGGLEPAGAASRPRPDLRATKR